MYDCMCVLYGPTAKLIDLKLNIVMEHILPCAHVKF